MDHVRNIERPITTGDDSSVSEDEGEREKKDVLMVEVGRPEWDCESILRYRIQVFSNYLFFTLFVCYLLELCLCYKMYGCGILSNWLVCYI